MEGEKRYDSNTSILSLLTNASSCKFLQLPAITRRTLSYFSGFFSYKILNTCNCKRWSFSDLNCPTERIIRSLFPMASLQRCDTLQGGYTVRILNLFIIPINDKILRKINLSVQRFSMWVRVQVLLTMTSSAHRPTSPYITEKNR